MEHHRLVGSQGVALGHRTIEAIGATIQPVTPRNYEIWLTYLADALPALNVSIDERLRQGGIFDDDVMADLYQKHFSSRTPRRDLIENGSRIAHEVADALDALNLAASQAHRYRQTLDSASVAFAEPSIDAQALHRVVSHMAKATADMAAQQEALSGKLSESSAEMEQLRIALAEARQQSLTDTLTGVANRKRFDETLRMRIGEALHDGTSLVVVMCDIDHFKNFNDKWGHQTGDAVIRLVAASLTKLAFGDQLVARLGGEEFGILMPRQTLKDAANLVDGMRRAIHANRLRRKGSDVMIGHVSASFGVAALRSGETGAQLVARADECLYLSKRNGRNRVSVETELFVS